MLDFWEIVLGDFICVREVPEVSRNLPEPHGSVLTEYQPVASHGDPIQPQNYGFSEFANSVVMLSSPENYYVDTINLLGAKK